MTIYNKPKVKTACALYVELYYWAMRMKKQGISMVDLINEGLYTIKRLCDKMGPDGYYYFVQARKEEEEKRKGKRKYNMKRKRKWQKSVEKMGL